MGRRAGPEQHIHSFVVAVARRKPKGMHAILVPGYHVRLAVHKSLQSLCMTSPGGSQGRSLAVLIGFIGIAPSSNQLRYNLSVAVPGTGEHRSSSLIVGGVGGAALGQQQPQHLSASPFAGRPQGRGPIAGGSVEGNPCCGKEFHGAEVAMEGCCPDRGTPIQAGLSWAGAGLHEQLDARGVPILGRGIHRSDSTCVWGLQGDAGFDQ
mmetsp:Transcript_17594/g.49174  ORF Transcript_17594/g.49174 Transcript_17594/m.49174 type:complete len:208 (+) Transcript_17594:1057-1680(+)